MNASSQTRFPIGEWTTLAPGETFQLGASIGGQLAGGEILLLNGTLGAGKTLLVKGIMHALDFDTREVTSPTFTLVNLYEARLRVFHLDLYRLDQGFRAADAVDLDELLADETSVIIIEWAERLAGYPMPVSNVYHISLFGDGDEPRRIKINNANQE